MEQTGLRKRPVTEYDGGHPSNATRKPSTPPTPKKRSWGDICKFTFFLILGILFFLYLFNRWVVSVEAKKYGKPPVGQMVKLEKGHSLYLNCQGKKNPNKPVVVLLMGFLLTEVTWYGEQKALVEKGWYVCTYDRSGIGWSEPDPDDFVTVQGFLNELHELIEVSGISKNEGGYVLVGLSMGASMIARYIEQWPTEPKGGYLIDPPIDGTNTELLSLFSILKKKFQVFQILSEYGLLRPLWYFGKLHPLAQFMDHMPNEITDSYLYLAAKTQGYYFGLLHESQLIEPGHGHICNESTLKFIAKYNKIPIQVELREGPFIHGVSGDGLNKEWYESRQRLKTILEDKQLAVNEDHLGKIRTDETLWAERTSGRILKFLEKWK